MRADTYPMRYFLGTKMLIDPMLIHYLTSRRELYTQISPQLAEYHIGLVEPWDGFPRLICLATQSIHVYAKRPW